MELKEDDLIGTWILSAEYYELDKAAYSRRLFFRQNLSGIRFKEGGGLVLRSNFDWCGTGGKGDLESLDGKWKRTSDSTIHIALPFWGGTSESDWEVLELTNKVEDETSEL